MLTTVEVPTIDVMLYRNQQMTPEVRDAAFDIRRRSFGTSGFSDILKLFRTRFGEIF